MKQIISFFSDRNIKYLLFIIFIVAIIPPISLIHIKSPLLSPDSDAFDYSQIAIGLLNGKGFHSNTTVAGIIKLPNARHPLYPFFIAAVYFFTNNSILAVLIIQILIHGLTCMIIFLISEKLFKNTLTSFGAGMIWALYPSSIYQSVFLLSETLFTFLLAMSVLFLLRNWGRPNLKNGFFSGLFLGLTALTKSVILAFIPFLFLWLFLLSRNKLMSKLKNFSIIMLFMVLTISPWLIRNYIVLKNFPIVATIGGLSFYRYNNEKTLDVIYTPMRVAYPFTDEQKRKISTLSEPEIDKYLYDLGWQFAKTHPRDFLKLKLTELCFFWHLWPTSPRRFTTYYLQKQKIATREMFLGSFLDKFIDRFKSSYFLYFCKVLYHTFYDILFLGMFVSLINSFKKNREQWNKSFLLFLLIAAINIVYIFHHGSGRYRMPIDPYVFILGLHGVKSIYDNLKRLPAYWAVRPGGRRK